MDLAEKCVAEEEEESSLEDDFHIAKGVVMYIGKQS